MRVRSAIKKTNRKEDKNSWKREEVILNMVIKIGLIEKWGVGEGRGASHEAIRKKRIFQKKETARVKDPEAGTW